MIMGVYSFTRRYEGFTWGGVRTMRKFRFMELTGKYPLLGMNYFTCSITEMKIN